MTDPSPLLTPTPDSLSLLFSVDPLTLSTSDRMSLIRELRRRRNEFTASEAAEKSKGKRARTKPDPMTSSEIAALAKPTTEIDLGDLT